MTRSKRAMDLALAIPGLIVVAPILMAIAVAMRLSGDAGPFLYRARRVGEGGSTFDVLKVRTMAQRSSGPALTMPGDSRVTTIGARLRRYRLDELPQLVNVVRGEMSIVGPRPEDPVFVDMADPLHRKVFSARPGITGLAQLEFHDEARSLATGDPLRIYREELLPAKLKLDALYLDSRTTRLDLEIIGRTLTTVVRRS